MSDEIWEPPERSKLRQIAANFVEAWGFGAESQLSDSSVRDALDLADLLSPADAIDDRADRASVEFVQSHVRWLLS